MNKEEILKMSREENEGRHDERERIAYGTASKVGLFIGGIICVLLVVISKLINLPEVGLAGWCAYFGMLGSSNLVLYKELKIKKSLGWGISELVFAVAFLIVLIMKSGALA